MHKSYQKRAAKSKATKNINNKKPSSTKQKRPTRRRSPSRTFKTTVTRKQPPTPLSALSNMRSPKITAPPVTLTIPKAKFTTTPLPKKTPTPFTTNKLSPKPKLPSVIFNTTGSIIGNDLTSINTVKSFPFSSFGADTKAQIEKIKNLDQSFQISNHHNHHNHKNTITNPLLPQINFLPNPSPETTSKRSFSRWWSGSKDKTETSSYDATYTMDSSGRGKFKIVEGFGTNNKPMSYEVTHGVVDPAKDIFSVKEFTTHDPRIAFSEGQEKARIASYGGPSSLGVEASRALEEGQQKVSSNPTTSIPTANAFEGTRSQRSDATFPGAASFDVVSESAKMIKETRQLNTRKNHEHHHMDPDANHPRHWRDTFE